MTPKSYRYRLLRDLIILATVLLALVVLAPRASRAALRVPGACVVTAPVAVPAVTVPVPVPTARHAGFHLRAVARPRVIKAGPVTVVLEQRPSRTVMVTPVAKARPMCGHRVWVPGHWAVRGLHRVWVPGHWRP